MNVGSTGVHRRVTFITSRLCILGGKSTYLYCKFATYMYIVLDIILCCQKETRKQRSIDLSETGVEETFAGHQGFWTPSPDTELCTRWPSVWTQTQITWSHRWWVYLNYTGMLYHSNQRFLGNGAYGQLSLKWYSSLLNDDLHNYVYVHNDIHVYVSVLYMEASYSKNNSAIMYMYVPS